IKDEGIPRLFPRDFLGGQRPVALFRRPRVTPSRTQQTYRSTPMVSLARRGGKLPLTALVLALAIGIVSSSTALAHGGGHGGGGGFGGMGHSGGMGHGGGLGHHGLGGLGGSGFYPGFYGGYGGYGYGYPYYGGYGTGYGYPLDGYGYG